MTIDLRERVTFESRHNSPSATEIPQMLSTIGADSVDQLIEQTIPASIRLKKKLNLPAPLNEYQYIAQLRKTAAKNKVFKSFIGQGYYNTVVPAVVQRNILENPAWYTAYTPYQAEIAQGRLEALINFQTLVMDLTGMEVANASLLDEGTAAAEAMAMLYGSRKGAKKSAEVFLVDEQAFPQTLEVLKTRAGSVGISMEIKAITDADLAREDVFAVFMQYPNNHGEVKDWTAFAQTAKQHDIFIACATDLLALCLLSPPGEWGADVVVGTSQRLGVPLGNGGPHAAFFATHEDFKRSMPGRIIGISKDANGNPAYRMALQTREQHIRREKATSNICTAQVLLSVMSSMYAVYHGPVGLKRIAKRVHGMAVSVAEALGKMGLQNTNKAWFDTLFIPMDPLTQSKVKQVSEGQGVNFRYFEQGIGISLDETHTPEDAQQVVNILAEATGKTATQISTSVSANIPANLARTSDFLTHPVFNQYHSEHEMLRYMKRLENKDLSLVHSMISLGSCTMKLNATSEMLPVTWPEFGNIHPFAPANQMEGYKELIGDLGSWLCEITGFDAVSFQPNSGAQGEYAGLIVIKAYLENLGQHRRTVALIPSSAHGTNPASAVMAGMQVVIVKCDERGNIDVADLKEKAAAHADTLACLMVTYPSTHGVFEESIIEICDIIHQYGGQVYMDGANMNAQVGLTSPANIGADVCHLNLHKTFCIPHGGGGPGMGPIGVRSHLAPFLPNLFAEKTDERNITMVSSAPYGSASILPISHAYIAMMGGEGLTRATQMAILNANYIQKRLSAHYPILYTNDKGRNAHEMIVDCRAFKAAGIEVEDIAKRLMDYGFHAPTVSFPVAGTLMIEPTESETKAELDRFCDAMIAIRTEIEEVMNGQADKQNNVLKNAPHTYDMICADEWTQPYAREKAAFPLPYVRAAKFWPTVRRIDSAYGDRNLVCSCLPVEAYEEVEA
jgi:glycine dehydrogenase